MAIHRGSLSKSPIKKALETKNKILRKKATAGLKSKIKKVSFNLDKSIVSYEPKPSVSHDSVPEKSSPMERAQEVQANLVSQFPSFLKPMLPSHVAGGFWLSFPKKFSDLHLPKHDDTVVLVDESGKEFETKYLIDKNGLSAGWRGFSIAHKLLEKDVLVFQMIGPGRFKVYIVRANGLTEIDGAIGLLNLDACVKPMDTDHSDLDMKISEMAREKHNNNDLEAAADQSEIDGDDYYTSEILEGIRFSQSITDFKDVKGIENFNILVDNLIIDSEIPPHLRIKYYELCCCQNSFLHDNLLNGLNLKLAAGVISETVNIADAIRSCKLSASRENLTIWDNTLKAFEDLGMNVGFLRARIKKLVSLLFESEDVVKCKRVEKAKAEEEMGNLEVKIMNVKDLLKNLDDEIEVLEMKGEKLEVVFMEEAKASW